MIADFRVWVERVKARAAQRYHLSGREFDPDGSPTPLVITRLSANTDASAIAALSSQCTHLGCTVLPQVCRPGSGCAPVGTRLLCPCHGSSFAIDGAVTAGPASINLLRYPSDFDGTTVVVSL